MAIRNRIEEVLPIAHPASAEAIELPERQISIFLFSTDYPYPILVDRAMRQAKGLEKTLVFVFFFFNEFSQP